MRLVLIRLVDMSLNTVFSNPHFWYMWNTGEVCFNQIGGHESQCFQILTEGIYRPTDGADLN